MSYGYMNHTAESYCIGGSAYYGDGGHKNYHISTNSLIQKTEAPSESEIIERVTKIEDKLQQLSDKIQQLLDKYETPKSETTNTNENNSDSSDDEEQKYLKNYHDTVDE